MTSWPKQPTIYAINTLVWLCDRFEHESAHGLRLHLLADPTCQDALIRFIENHDEPRPDGFILAHKRRAAMLPGEADNPGERG